IWAGSILGTYLLIARPLDCRPERARAAGLMLWPRVTHRNKAPTSGRPGVGRVSIDTGATRAHVRDIRRINTGATDGGCYAEVFPGPRPERHESPASRAPR